MGVRVHGVTRVRLDAEAPTLMECAAVLDKATAFLLERRFKTSFTWPNASGSALPFSGRVTVSGPVASGSWVTPTPMQSDSLFDGLSHEFVEETFESKVTEHGSVYFVGRRVIAVDRDEDDAKLLVSPLAGMPSVPSVPLAIEAGGRARAIAVSSNAGAADIIDAIYAAPWWKEDSDGSRWALTALDGGEWRTLYKGTVPSIVTGLHAPMMLSAYKLEDLERMQPLYLSPDEDSVGVAPEPIDYADGWLYEPARSARIGEGVEAEVIVQGAPTNVWVASDVTARRAAEIAAAAQGFAHVTERGWELRTTNGNLVDSTVRLANMHERLFLNPSAGSGA